MPHTRRRTLLATAAVAGAVLAGCGQQTADATYRIYARNETELPYELTVEAVDEGGGVFFTAESDGAVLPDAAATFGPFDGSLARIRVLADGVHPDQESKTFEEPYRQPEEDCSAVVLNRVWLRPDGSESESACVEQ